MEGRGKIQKTGICGGEGRNTRQQLMGYETDKGRRAEEIETDKRWGEKRNSR